MPRSVAKRMLDLGSDMHNSRTEHERNPTGATTARRIVLVSNTQNAVEYIQPFAWRSSSACKVVNHENSRGWGWYEYEYEYEDEST